MNGGTETKYASQIQRSFVICVYKVNYNRHNSFLTQQNILVYILIC